MKNPHRIATYCLCLGAIAILIYLTTQRLFFPYEILWMEGSILEQVYRMHSGQALYSAPSLEYVAWPYQPLYYYVTYIISSFTGVTFLSGRLVSLSSTICTALILYHGLKKATGEFYYGIAAAGLFLAAVVKAGVFFDSVRVDALSVTLLVASFVILLDGSKSRSIFFSSLFFAASYFTKQSALFFFPGILIYLYYCAGWKKSALFFLESGVLLIGISLVLDEQYHGWHYYFTTIVPAARRKTIDWAVGLSALGGYVILRCWLLTTIGVLVITYQIIKRASPVENTVVLGSLFFLSSLVLAFIGISNEGGAHNLVLPCSAACAFFLPLAINQLGPLSHRGMLLHWVLPLQLCTLISFPFFDKNVIPRDAVVSDGNALLEFIAATPKEIWLPRHGFLPVLSGKKPYAEGLALRDVLLVGDSVARSLNNQYEAALSNHYWSAILEDADTRIPHYRNVGLTRNFTQVHFSDKQGLYLFLPER